MLIRFMALVISDYSYGREVHTHWGYDKFTRNTAEVNIVGNERVFQVPPLPNFIILIPDTKCNPQTLVWEVGCQSCLLTAAIPLALLALSAGEPVKSQINFPVRLAATADYTAVVNHCEVDTSKLLYTSKTTVQRPHAYCTMMHQAHTPSGCGLPLPYE